MLFQLPPEMQLWFSKGDCWGGCFGFPAHSALSASALSAPLPNPAMWLGIHALVGVLSFNFHASFIAFCGDFVK